MSIEQNKATVRKYFDEVVNHGNLSLLDRTVSRQAESLRQAISIFFAAFPDAQTVVDDLIAEGDRVVVRSTTRATHKGAFLGIAPTGRTVKYLGVDIFRVENGQITEHWFVRDHLMLMEQLGVISRIARR